MHGNQVIRSKLCRQIIKDNVPLSVEIYRPPDEDGWVLVVTDDLAYSTAWSDPFPTDEAALAEFLAVLAEQGAETFAVGRKLSRK